jgi:hypothetical protein
MKEKICLTGLLLGTNCGCMTTNPKQNMLLCSGGKRFADVKEVQTEVRKWLRQESMDFYSLDFDAVVKRWDKCISVSGGHVEK